VSKKGAGPRGELVKAYVSWARDSGAFFDADTVRLLLDYRAEYRDQSLTRWSAEDLSAVLLGLFPAKVVIGGDEVADVVPAVRTFVEFLGSTGRLAKASDPLEDLLEELDEIEEVFEEAMGGPDAFGFAKRIALTMIEDGVAPDDLALAKPVLAIKDVSWDVSLQKLLPLKDGRKLRALDMQWQLFEKAEKWAQERGMASVGEEVGAEVLQRWERVLTALEVDPMSLSKQLDWVAKYRLVLGFQDRHGLTWGDARLRAIDLQYHDMRPERSLFARVGMETLISDEDVESATTEPRTTTRAYFRGRCLAKWPDDIVAANWDSMVFDIGRDPLRRVPMMEPLRGTADLVGSLIDECATAAELLDRLGS